MGFFADLKDDLSQAVNELMPEEEFEAALAGAEGNQMEAADLGITEPIESVEAALSQDAMPTSDDLSDMLDMMDMMDMVESINIENEQIDEEDLEAVLAQSEPIIEESGQAAEPVQTDAVPEMDVQLEVSAEPAAEEPAKAEPVAETKKSQHEKRGEEKKMEMQSKTPTDETAIVTEGMSITGDIASGGSLELIGTVIGNIEVLGKLNITGAIQGNSKAAEIFAEGARINGEINSQGSVKIGLSSVVIGNINANSAVIAGAVKGDIDVHGPVILDTSAIVMGNIKSKSVQINNGAVIEGMCSQCYADVNPMTFFEEIKNKNKKEK